ncbi:MarR family winged helix-turn-helix transcriptional regulator [Mycobacterium sp.]|uniref:MarR family winged helix-turn-helix transcriptional regulator n=2 Tax=Mycobacterium sp. TaxID=1785 RepID=UPI003C753558
MMVRLEIVTSTEGSEPWLDDDQQQAWRHVVGLFMTLPGAIDSDLQRNAGMTLYEYLVLASLSEAPDGTLQMSDLAHRANSTLSRLSHVISRLEKRGWVVKRPCENDRRASTVVLTAAGKKKIHGAAPGHAELVQQLVVEPLSAAQLRHLGEAAAAVVQAIDTANRGRKQSAEK